MRLILKRILCATGTCAMALTAPMGHAEWDATAGISSNYVFRGFTQTDDKMALQGTVEYSDTSGSYAGAWGSTVDEGIELDLYLGNRGTTKGINYDFGLISHEYSDNDFFDGSIREIYVGGGYGPVSLRIFDGFTKRHEGQFDQTYYDLGLRFALPRAYVLNLHYGVLDSEFYPIDNIKDYSVQLSKQVSGINLAISYARNDQNDEDTVFVTLTKGYSL